MTFSAIIAVGFGNGILSTKSAAKSGIPQRSILGPLLFIICVTDLPRHIKNHCMMFADDTTLFGNPGEAYTENTWQINN